MHLLNRAVRMVRFGIHIGRPLGAQHSELSDVPARLLWLCGVLAGVFKYRKERRRGYVSKPTQGVPAR